MGWQVNINGVLEVVDGNKLKSLAASGVLKRDSMVKSLSKNKMCPAGEIPGLKWPDDLEIVPDLSGIHGDVFDSLPPVSGDIKSEAAAVLLQAIAMDRKQQADSEVAKEPEWAKDYRKDAVQKKPRPGFFDIRFNSFVTVDLVSLAWQFALWFVFFGSILQFVLVLRFIPSSSDPVVRALQVFVAAVVSLILGSIAALIARVFLEAIVVLFKIEEHLRG